MPVMMRACGAKEVERTDERVDGGRLDRQCAID